MAVMTEEALLALVHRELPYVAPTVEPGDLSFDTSFAEAGVDSLAVATLAATIEDEFGIILPEEDIVEVDSVRTLYDVVLRRSR